MLKRLTWYLIFKADWYNPEKPFSFKLSFYIGDYICQLPRTQNIDNIFVNMPHEQINDTMRVVFMMVRYILIIATGT